MSLSKHFIDCRKRYVLLIESHSAYEINCCETGLANDVNDPMNFKHSYAGLIEIVSNQLNVVNCTRWSVTDPNCLHHGEVYEWYLVWMISKRDVAVAIGGRVRCTFQGKNSWKHQNYRNDQILHDQVVLGWPSETISLPGRSTENRIFFVSCDSLQQQHQQQEQQQQSSIMSNVLNHVNGNNSRAPVNERQQVERRLSIINHDIDTKKAAIKNIRLLLQQTSVTE